MASDNTTLTKGTKVETQYKHVTMTNKPETINGRLLQFYGEWKIQSGYGTFPLKKTLQQKPDIGSNGAWCKATVLHGEVTEYCFADESV